ncbi:MAG: C45 family autoproteolytic acyltransferase/hydrolase [Pirellulaceae bacterium]
MFLGQSAAWIGAATLPIAAGSAGVRGTQEEVLPFGEAVVISGSPQERGQAYGDRFATEIRYFFEHEIERAFVGKPSTHDDLLRYAAACWKVIERECPEIAAEMAGMSAGCGLSLEHTVLLTLHEELYHRGVLPPVPHCTAVAVTKPETRDGTTYCGQTWDWMPSVAGMSTVLRWRRAEGPELLAYGFPGLWLGAGLNSNGLALCWTSAELGKSGQSPRIGLPSYVFLAHLLYQENLDAVRDAALRHRHAGWFTFVMADGDGRLMNIEGSPEGIEVVESPGRLVRVGFGTHRMSGIPQGRVIERHPRCISVDTLFDPLKGDIQLSTLQSAFSDSSLGICAGPTTIDIMVFDTTRRTAYLSRGADYGIQWCEYRFA